MSGAGSLGKAVLELATDDGALEKGLAAAHEKSKGWGVGVSGIAKGAAFAIAGVGAAATGIVGAMVASARSVQNEAIEIDKLRRETGLSIQQASELKYAAGRLNIDTDALSTSFGVLSKNIQMNTTQFQDEHVQVVRTKDGHVDLEATTAKLADRFKAMPDGVEKTALSMQLFGKQGKDMIPLLNQGSDGLKAMGDEAARMGLVFDEKTVAASYRLRDAQKTLGDHVEGLKNRIGIAFMPTLADWTGGLVHAADAVLPAVSTALETVTGWLGKGVDAIKGPATAALDLGIGAVKAFADLWRGGDVEIGNFADTFQRIFGVHIPEWALQAVGSVVGQLAKLPGFVAQVVGSIGEIFDVATGRRPEAGGMLSSLVGRKDAIAIMTTVAGVREAVRAVSAKIAEAFEAARDRLGPVFAKIGEWLHELQKKWDDLPGPMKQYMSDLAAAAVVTTTAGPAFLGVGANIAQIGSSIGGLVVKLPILKTIGPMLAELALQAALAGGGIAGWAAAIGTGIMGVVFSIPMAIAAIVGGLIFISQHLDDLRAIWDAFGYAAAAVWKKLGDTVGDVGSAIGGFFNGFGSAISAIGPAIGAFAADVTAAIGGLFSGIGTAVHDFLGFWGGVWSEISSQPGHYLGLAFGAIVVTLLNIAQAIGDFTGNALRTVVQWLVDSAAAVILFFAALPGNIAGWLGSALQAITSFAAAAKQAAATWLQDTKASVWDFFTALPGNVGGFLVGVVRAIAGFGLDALHAVTLWIAQTDSTISDYFTALPGDMLQFGKDIVTGLWNGVSGMATWIEQQMEGFIGGVVDAIRAGLGNPHSPAPATIPLGEAIVQGLTYGINNKSPEAVAAVQLMLKSIQGVSHQIVEAMTFNTKFGTAVVQPGTEGLGLVRSDQSIIGHAGAIPIFGPSEQTINLHIDGKQVASVVANRFNAQNILAGGIVA